MATEEDTFSYFNPASGFLEAFGDLIDVGDVFCNWIQI